MTAFILIAAALVAVAAAVVIIPLAARGRSAAPPAVWSALVVLTILGGGGAALYAKLGNRAWNDAAQADTPQAMVGRLARRLERNPQDLNGWLMLARSYAALEEFPLAARAYQHADQLAGGKSIEAVTGLAEALVLDDETQLTGRAGQLFERALVLDPTSGKALFYGAAAAQRRGDLRLARQRFQALLDEAPPEEVRPILERQIAALDQQLGNRVASAAPGAAASAAGAAGAPVQSTQERSGAPAALVRVHVSIDPKMAARAPANAPCFVFVRRPGAPGPPLAVRRVAQNFPQTIELSSADAMIAGHGIEPNEEVEVIARISVSGSPQAHSGDLFGSTRLTVGRASDANVEINQLAP